MFGIKWGAGKRRGSPDSPETEEPQSQETRQEPEAAPAEDTAQEEAAQADTAADGDSDSPEGEGQADAQEQTDEESPEDEEPPTELFGLTVGMRVEVLNLDNRLLFLGKVRDLYKESLQVEEAKEQRLPPILYNSEIKLRTFLRGGGTITLFGKVCGSNESFWRVDRLRRMYDLEKREYYRQRLNIPAKLLCTNSIFNPEVAAQASDKTAIPCILLDISVGGLLFRCKDRHFTPGDWLFVLGAEIVPEERPFSFSCRVLRVITREHGVEEYGCCFEGLEPKEQDRLSRAILIVQRMDIQAQRERGMLL